MQLPEGVSSEMVITARHLANLAPRRAYSFRRSRRPSRPSVTSSPGKPASGTVPLSTLMPGRMPFFAMYSANGTPLRVAWRRVSSYRIAPEMCCDRFGVVSSISR